MKKNGAGVMSLPCTKINAEWINALNVNSKMLKVQEKNNIKQGPCKVHGHEGDKKKNETEVNTTAGAR